MLLIFLGSECESINSLLPQTNCENPHAIIIAQQGVYHIDNILIALHGRQDILIHALRRDLTATGLLSIAEKNDKIHVIDFSQFVTLSTQHTPCITVQ